MPGAPVTRPLLRWADEPAPRDRGAYRSNLVGMGVLPLQFKGGENAQSVGLDGSETFDIWGSAEGLKPHADLIVTARTDDGDTKEFTVECRIDSEVELDYYRHGGVLQMVVRRMLSESQ